MTWLSRGLLEAILAFIGQANSDHWALRAAVYEFTQADVLAAFKTAHESGADVQIVYHAVDDDAGWPNKTAIANAALPAAILIPRSHTTTIAHNKFIVLCKKSAAGKLEPIEVWTGSTNLSEGGNERQCALDEDRAETNHLSKQQDELTSAPERRGVTPRQAFDASAAGAEPAKRQRQPRLQRTRRATLRSRSR